MQVDRSEFQNLEKKNIGSNKVNQLKSLLTKMEQASLNAEHLTHDSTWNIFLQMLQSWVEQTSEQVKFFETKLISPEVVNNDQIHKLKNYIIMCHERIAVLESVIALPVQIMEAGQLAKLELEQIGSRNKEKDSLDNP